MYKNQMNSSGSNASLEHKRTFKYWCAMQRSVDNDPNRFIPVIRSDDARVKRIDLDTWIQETDYPNRLPKHICFFETKIGYTWDDLRTMAHIVQPIKAIVAAKDKDAYEFNMNAIQDFVVEMDDQDTISTKEDTSCFGQSQMQILGLGNCTSAVQLRHATSKRSRVE